MRVQNVASCPALTISNFIGYIAEPVIRLADHRDVYPPNSCIGNAVVDDQQQQNHDRDLKIARNEAKREFFSDVRLSTWATSIALLFALALLTFYLTRK